MPTFKRRDHGVGHSYWLVDDKGVETQIPGVTTILGDAIPKNALKRWAAEQAAEYAVANWAELGQMPVLARGKAIATAWDTVRAEAAKRGTNIHRLAEKLQAGEEVEVPEGLEGLVESCVKFLDEWDVQPVLSETSVLNRSVPYAGTLDIVCDFAGARWLVDWKTSRSGVYAEAALQLSAYAHADVYINEAGVEQSLAGLGIQRGAVVHLRSDGYDIHPMTIGDRAFSVFRHAAFMAEWLHWDKNGDDLGRHTRLDTLKLPVLQPARVNA
jgi:hypothetical protein